MPGEAGLSPPLWTAASQGRLEEVRKILREGVRDLEQRGGWKLSTPLHTAALHGYNDVCHLLLDKGADVSAKDRTGCTPLHDAAGRGHEALVRLLLEHGADFYLETNDGFTPEDIASARSHFHIVAMLKEAATRKAS